MGFNTKNFKEKMKKNKEDRLKFVDFWVDFMKKNPKKWSKQQKELIDSQY